MPDFILAMRNRGHPEALIRKVVYENPLEFFRQSRNFQFTPRDGGAVVEHDDAERGGTKAAGGVREAAISACAAVDLY